MKITKATKIIAGVIFSTLVAIQFIRPSLPNPPITADLQVSTEAKQILVRACYNCHSNQTKLAWFDQLQPVYWLVAAHVKEARKHMNFSTWDSLSAPAQKAKLFESVNMIQLDNMPLSSYKAVHSGAAVTQDEVVLLKNYLNTLVINKPADTASIHAANKQYDQWIRGDGNAIRVKPAPNGIEFIPDYKNWRTISTTDRFDNGTMRVILGNDIAIKAIKEQHISPWPDGAIFAKVAWEQLKDSSGNVQTGAFKQIEYMIKDSKKYASTKGWGWARWINGIKLIPYGKNTLFTNECTTCHEPMKNNDYVFSMPLKHISK